ncbi:hypothetical protein [Actinoplanes regularis]|uniref:Lipoprotein n=1 Tax=Actinoplanes regularis TaxID=52697 RepID=A0A238ZYD5_9ACTN|nr:hypothetical protein [Actinoplanes regularis]GIE90192.1 hypothetical protein Are01nite_66720 [Actinoplanes regularis]SNR87888.1 hypothetical protein SAMN06264365_106377 [Actinoplanes regularis]
MSIRAVSILIVSAALALATAACSNTEDGGTANASTGSVAPTTAAPAPSTTGATGGATTVVPTTVKATDGSTAEAGQVCPVTVETLLAAMRADKNGGSRLAQGATLGKPECYDGYVLIRQTSIKDANGEPVADDEVARFKHESDGWRYQGSHSADYCDGMPDATAEYFASDFSGACARPE